MLLAPEFKIIGLSKSSSDAPFSQKRTRSAENNQGKVNLQFSVFHVEAEVVSRVLEHLDFLLVGGNPLLLVVLRAFS